MIVDSLADDETLRVAAVPPAPAVADVAVASWGVTSSVGHVRATNEDAWAQREDMFVVADGMGGHVGGDTAARATAGLMIEVVEPGRWADRVREVNDAVIARCAAAGVSGAGSTLAGVHVQPDRATIVSVGDSRVHRIRAGRLEQLTTDHTVGNDLLAAGVDAARQRTAGRRIGGLTSWIGMTTDRLRVTVTDVQVRHGDCFLVTTDGVHDQVEPSRLERVVDSLAPDQASRRLVQLADDAGGRDNATALVVAVRRREGNVT